MCELSYGGVLKMWTVDHWDWCVAASAEEAADAFEVTNGYRMRRAWVPGEKDQDRPEATWVEESPWDLFNYTPDEGVTYVLKTFADWVLERGAGYFCRRS